MLEIKKNIKEDIYFIKSVAYKYSFDWDTLHEIRKRLFDYPTIDLIDSFYSDLDRFSRQKIKKEKLE